MGQMRGARISGYSSHSQRGRAGRRRPNGRAIHTRHYYTARSRTVSPGKRHKAQLLPPPTDRQRFRRRLLSWYRRHGRDLPWRHTQNPYHILVSEIMLQQTQVDRVVPKYEEWLAEYPTFESLAAATPGRASRTWYPLGYNIRPRRLHAIAREVVRRCDGRLPADVASLKSFKGLGDYTVGAVRSFAFGIRAPIVDTNISRLLFRMFVADGDPKGHRIKRHLWALSGALLPRRHAFDFNQALMDFGAMVCTPRTPRCPECPMRPDCRSFASSERQRDPGAKKRKRAAR